MDADKLGIQWKPSASMGFMNTGIATLEAVDTHFVAFYIKGKDSILGLDKINLSGEYEPLQNNSCIYFLIGSRGEKPNIYVGQAVARVGNCCAARLKEHAKNVNERYYNDWDDALVVTKTTGSFSSGVLDTLEAKLIELVKCEGVNVLNKKVGTAGNVDLVEYINALYAITSLLDSESLNFKMLHESLGGILDSSIDAELNKYNNSDIQKVVADGVSEDTDGDKVSKRLAVVGIYERMMENLATSGLLVEGRIYSSAQIKNYLLYNKVSSKRIKSSSVITPGNIVKDMVDMIPVECFNSKSKFLNLYNKSGEFVINLIDRFLGIGAYTGRNEDLPINREPEFQGVWNLRKKINHIVQNQIYSICGSLAEYSVANKRVVKHIEDIIDSICEIEAGGNTITNSDTNAFGVSGVAGKWRVSAFDRNSIFPRTATMSNLELSVNGYTTLNDIAKRREVRVNILKNLGFNTSEGDDTMKFNVVIGNPPYNNDLYLDFVNLGKDLSTEYCCMVTPAKWQAKTDGKTKGSTKTDKNEYFRSETVPYMRDIVFYPDTKEVFDIADSGGVSYYLLGKSKCEVKNIKSICENSNIFCSEFEPHDETTPTLFNDTILRVVGKIGTLGDGFKQSLYVKNTDRGEDTISGTLGFKRQVFVGEQDRGSNYDTMEELKSDKYVDVMQGEKVTGYKKISELNSTLNLDKYKMVVNIMVGGTAGMLLDSTGKYQRYLKIYCLKPYQVPKGSFPVLKYFDTEEECKSFMSYFNTKTVSFLFGLGLCGVTLTREFFRYIPDPKDWTVTYEDRALPNYTPDPETGIYVDEQGKKHCSLYIKYHLTEEEINIIESVIKERK